MNTPEGAAQHFLKCGIKNCERNCQYYCNPCHLELCEQCRNEHLKSRENRNHEVVLYQQFKLPLQLEKCKIHTNKDVDLLCEECQAPLCSKCTTLVEHRRHAFLDLETFCAEKSAQCKEEISKIQEYFLPTSQDLLKEIKEDSLEIKKIMDNLRTSMKSDAESLKSLVDEVHSENMKQLDQIEHSLLEDLKSQEKTFNDYILYLEDLVKEFSGHLSSKQSQKLISLTTERLKTKSIPNTTKQIASEYTTRKYCKDDVRKLLGRMNAPMVKRKNREIREMKISTIKESATQQQKERIKQKPDVKEILSILSYPRKIREFKVPNFNGDYISLDDQSGRLWVNDLRGILVQTDLEGNEIQRTQTSDSGCGNHTVSQNGDLIFTDRFNKVINRITQDKNITEFLKTGDWEPLCIHSSKLNGDLLVGMGKDRAAKITRYNTTGKELQNIGADKTRQRLHSNETPIYQYITENINGDICTSETSTCKWSRRNIVVVMNKSGQYRFSYQGDQGERIDLGINDICTDALGHILVSCMDTVHLLNQDGQLLCRLFNPRVYFPYTIITSLCVDDENNLYVGLSEFNTVTVYKYLK